MKTYNILEEYLFLFRVLLPVDMLWQKQTSFFKTVQTQS